MKAGEPGWGAATIVLNGPGTFPGSPNGSNYENIIAGQLHFPIANLFANPDDPILVWQCEYSTSDFTPRTIDLASQTSKYDIYMPMIYPFTTPGTSSSLLSVFVEGAGSITIVPTPGSLATLLLLGTMRRRRG